MKTNNMTTSLNGLSIRRFKITAVGIALIAVLAGVPSYAGGLRFAPKDCGNDLPKEDCTSKATDMAGAEVTEGTPINTNKNCGTLVSNPNFTCGMRTGFGSE